MHDLDNENRGTAIFQAAKFCNDFVRQIPVPGIFSDFVVRPFQVVRFQ